MVNLQGGGPQGPESAMSLGAKKTGKEVAEHILDADWHETQDGQRLFFVEWGTRGGTPFILLHGGPGTGFGPSHVALFDPTIHHVIFFDQRGCGKSTPPASSLDEEAATECARTSNIINDVEALRQRFFKDKKVNLAGTSWGSTAPLAYAEEHPDRVLSLQIGSIFLGTKREVNETFEHQRKDNFPYQREYEHFIRDLANGDEHLYQRLKRMSGRQMVNYLAKKITDPDTVAATRHAVAFETYEYVLCAPHGYTYETGYEELRKEVAEDPNTLSHGRIEILSHKNGAFLKPNQLLKRIGRIKHIPITIVQGKKDWCTPTKYAKELEKAVGRAGGQCTLEEVDDGHLRSDPNMKAALQRNMLTAPKE